MTGADMNERKELVEQFLAEYRCSNTVICHADDLMALVAALSQPSPDAAPAVPLLDAVRAIRTSDCGGWLKKDEVGSEKRLQMMRLLDALYRAYEQATGEKP